MPGYLKLAHSGYPERVVHRLRALWKNLSHLLLGLHIPLVTREVQAVWVGQELPGLYA